MKRYQNKSIKIILTLPRCGTHFLWSRHIASKNYQLLYDADIIPALSVLADKCPEKLDFLNLASENPNYNFQYGSQWAACENMTAKEHLEYLKSKYRAVSSFDLFNRILNLQDNTTKYLFSVNRFVYTNSYHFLFHNFIWTIEHAAEALEKMKKWFESTEFETRYVMVVRHFPNWLQSMLKMKGTRSTDWIQKELLESYYILKMCINLKIPIFVMDQIIPLVKQDILEFDEYLEPLSSDQIDEVWGNPEVYLHDTLTKLPKRRPKLFRFRRFLQYAMERDPIKRTSLVRSIGRPYKISKIIPFLRKRIRTDLNGTVLYNAKIKAG